MHYEQDMQHYEQACYLRSPPNVKRSNSSFLALSSEASTRTFNRCVAWRCGGRSRTCLAWYPGMQIKKFCLASLVSISVDVAKHPQVWQGGGNRMILAIKAAYLGGLLIYYGMQRLDLVSRAQPRSALPSHLLKIKGHSWLTEDTPLDAQRYGVRENIHDETWDVCNSHRDSTMLQDVTRSGFFAQNEEFSLGCSWTESGFHTWRPLFSKS